MTGEHWLWTLMKDPARIGRRLIDFFYVWAHWPEIDKEFRRREDLIRFVEAEKDKRLQYEREAKDRLDAEYRQQLDKISKERDDLSGLTHESLEIAKMLNASLEKSIITCAYAVVSLDLHLRDIILRLAGGLRGRLEKEIGEIEKSFLETPPETEQRRRGPGLLLRVPPSPSQIPPQATERTAPPEKEDDK